MRLLIASLAIVPLTACTIAQSDATAPGPPAGTCHNEALGQFTGQPASEAIGERMLRIGRTDHPLGTEGQRRHDGI